MPAQCPDLSQTLCLTIKIVLGVDISLSLIISYLMYPRWSIPQARLQPEGRVLKGSFSLTHPGMSNRPMTTPRLTVILQLRFEQSLFAPKKNLSYMNGPCCMQAMFNQIGHSDTPDCHGKRRPVENLTNGFPISGNPGLTAVGRQNPRWLL